jgi:hypothetical protein
MKPIQPNKIYRIIGSAVGPSGSSVGRKCITISQIPGVQHTLWGICWTVESADGLPFDSIREGIEGFPEVKGRSMRIACAEDWLEEEPEPEPDAEMREVEKEITA